MIVVESGGTKATWIFQQNTGELKKIETVGLHPQEITEEKKRMIAQLICNHSLKGQKIYFFGAGCESQEAKTKIKNFLSTLGLFPIQIDTDIYAAALASLKKKDGIIGILGTGAVAAKFENGKITQQTSGLGYLLGDEGSGFDIGKRLLQYYFSQKLPSEMEEKIKSYFGNVSILHRIYEQDGRQKIAGLSMIVKDYEEAPIIEGLLQEAFSDFCKTALQPIKSSGEVYFVGSIAYHFQTILKNVLATHDYKMKGVQIAAIDELYQFILSTR